ncbi:MFS transporter [Nonomuraea sp. NPDC049607]|uniref:MFS transporter n=1 Tax=Nonomuraea sp. NPDC049607 TaxID=3154732 RepID=UPI003440CCF3
MTAPPRPDSEPGQAPFGPRFVTAVSVGSLLNPINSSIIAIALVPIAHHFGVGADATSWLVSGLYLATAIGQPVLGRLADRLGPRRVYLAGLVTVAAGGLLGYWAPTLGLLVAARVLIGLGTSAAYPAAMSMVRRRSERSGGAAPASVMGALAMAGQVSMVLGPPLGGLLDALGGWRWIFLVNLPMAAAGVVSALVWLPRDEPYERARTGGGGSLRDLARNRPLLVTYLRNAVTFMATYGFLYGWTQWLEQGRGLTAAVAGLLLMPTSAVGAVVSGLAARADGASGRARWMLPAGAAFLLAGCAWLPALDGEASVLSLCLLSMVFGVQNGLNIVGNQAAMYAQAPPGQIGMAAGLLRTSQYAGAICSALLISVTYGERATDEGLHRLGVVLTAASALLLAGTLLAAVRAGRTPAASGRA